MKRYLSAAIQKLALGRDKMAFISGPRQVGKTTLARSYSTEYDQFTYYNWDEAEFRRLWTKSPNQVQASFNLLKSQESKLLVLDEIHKSKGWKQKVKGIYDHFKDDFRIIVTGSARLNIYKKGGDSLMGRYLNFRLHPLSYGELLESTIESPESWRRELFKKNDLRLATDPFNNLLRFSGFPEPYFSASPQILNIWRRGRTEKIVREDLRDLSRLPELSQVEMLTSLLPSKVGSPLSVQSLREDLEVAHDTVTRWLRYLHELYYYFDVAPWSKSVPRSLKKEKKIYLFDWTELNDPGAKFENFVACHLKKACDFWTDTGEGSFELFYARTKEKVEIDFVITKDRKPWLAVETKTSAGSLPTKEVHRLAAYLKCPLAFVVQEEKVWRTTKDFVAVSADRFLAGLP